MKILIFLHISTEPCWDHFELVELVDKKLMFVQKSLFDDIQARFITAAREDMC